MKALKIIGAVFCGLMTLAGIGTLLSPESSKESVVANLILTLVFLGLTILLIFRIVKNGNKKDISKQTIANQQYLQKQQETAKGEIRMFTKKESCAICGAKLHGTIFTQLTDGKICSMCARICNGSGFVSTSTVKQALEENRRRYRLFHESIVVSSILCGFIFVDFEHQWAYVSSTKKPKVEPIVFHFSEIEQYSITQVGAKTITKTKNKGGIGRAIIGGAIAGPVGAIVGSATAKTEAETKTVGGTPILTFELNINGVKTRVTLANPPFEAEKTINSMMES